MGGVSSSYWRLGFYLTLLEGLLHVDVTKTTSSKIVLGLFRCRKEFEFGNPISDRYSSSLAPIGICVFFFT